MRLSIALNRTRPLVANLCTVQPKTSIEWIDPVTVWLGDCVEYNWLMILLRADAFQPMAEFRKRTEAFVEQVRGSKTAEDVERVMMPGERETNLARQAADAGIQISDGVWAGIIEAAKSVGVKANGSGFYRYTSV